MSKLFMLNADTALELVQESGLLTHFKTSIRGRNSKLFAYCYIEREGKGIQIYSYEGPLGKSEAWTKYPRQMLRKKIIQIALKNTFPDIIEEAYIEFKQQP